MAADILVYRATHVPVGDDQKQHLELTRDIAQKFNNDFSPRIADLGVGVEMMVGEEKVNGFFPLTEPLIEGPAPRVMSLRDGSKKMSKSDPSDLSRINLTDDADTISKKIRKAKTDPEALPSEADGLKGRPEAENLVGIYAALAETSQGQRAGEFGGQAVFRVQAGAGRPCGREAGADRRRDAPHLGRSRLCRFGAARWRRTGRREGGSHHENGARHRRIAGKLGQFDLLSVQDCLESGEISLFRPKNGPQSAIADAGSTGIGLPPASAGGRLRVVDRDRARE